MVQHLGSLRNHKGELADSLGMSLGKGLGNALNTHFANRSLQSVLQDKSLENAPPSVRIQRLNEALSPYGEKGQEVLQQAIQTQQLQAQEAQVKKNEALQKRKGAAIGKVSRGENLTDDDWSLFTPQEIESLNKAYKAKNGGEEFAKIREKNVAETVNNALNKRDEAENLKYNFAEARKAVGGEIQGPGFKATLKNNPYGQLLVGLTPDESALQAVNKKLLEGTKGIFGSKPTEREVFLLLNGMLPSIGKSKEANLAGLDVLEKAIDLAILHSNLIDQITEGGTKYVPNLESQVNERMKHIINEFKEYAYKVNESINNPGKSNSNTNQNGKVKVKSPDGRIGYMTQEQINSAKAQNVIFTPVQ